MDKTVYPDLMIHTGFEVGGLTPCLPWHTQICILVGVHGDDFTNTGTEDSLAWFKHEISKAFETKREARLGPDKSDDKSVRTLNRIITWRGGKGIAYEAHQRHAELLVESLELQTANKVSTQA